jgi:hypothetical protein
MTLIDGRAPRVTPIVAGLATIALLLPGTTLHAQVATLDERVAGAQRVVVATARSVVPEWRENSHGDRLIVSGTQSLADAAPVAVEP